MNYNALARELADHLEAIAGTLRRHAATEGDQSRAQNGPLPKDHGKPLDPDAAVETARQVHPQLGSHQEMAIRALAKAHPYGLPASAITPDSSSMPNTYTTLEKLVELRLICRQEGRPRRYYLGPKMGSSP